MNAALQHPKWPVILVSPKGERNVGGVARLMGNFGFDELRIVDPRCDFLDVEAKKMAMTSFDILEHAKVFKTFEEAIEDRTYCIAMSGRPTEDQRPRSSLYAFAEQLNGQINADDRVALVFGREEWGLRLEELDRCNCVVEIPTLPEKPSMNLASAVGVTLSYFFYLSDRGGVQAQREILKPKKTDEDLFFQRVWKILDETKFINPQNPSLHMPDLRALFNRANVSERDLRILFGILSGIESKMGFK